MLYEKDIAFEPRFLKFCQINSQPLARRIYRSEVKEETAKPAGDTNEGRCAVAMAGSENICERNAETHQLASVTNK